MQISSTVEKYVMYCPEITKCAYNGIQENFICVILLYLESWMLGMTGVIVSYLALAEWTETMSADLAAEMPFYQIIDYDLELELTTCKTRILKLLGEN